MLQILNDIVGLIGSLVFDLIVVVVSGVLVGLLGAWLMSRLTTAIYQGRDSDLQSIPATLLGLVVGGIIGGATTVVTLMAGGNLASVCNHVLGVGAVLAIVGILIVRIVDAGKKRR